MIYFTYYVIFVVLVDIYISIEYKKEIKLVNDTICNKVVTGYI